MTYVTGIVSSLVSAVLSPFAAGLPALPADPSTLWALLAWVRREFFNSSPTINYNPLQNTQSLNRRRRADHRQHRRRRRRRRPADLHRHRPAAQRRRRSTIDEDGNFIYRPMNAMAAVGGTDSVHRGRQRRGRRPARPRPAGAAAVRADPRQLPQSRRRPRGRADHHRHRRPGRRRRPVVPRRLPLGRRARGVPGRGRPRLAGGSQLRLVQVGARPDQPAARADQRRAGERARHLRLVRQRRRSWPATSSA